MVGQAGITEGLCFCMVWVFSRVYVGCLFGGKRPFGGYLMHASPFRVRVGGAAP